MTRWHLNHPLHGDKPWAVQAEALRRADGRDKFGFWLEQGLGKTSLTMNEFIDRDDVDLNIVVAPNSFKLDWALAPAEWGVGFMRSGCWPKDPLPFGWEMGQYSINYEAVSRSQATEPLRKLMSSRRCMLTIDESKALGNPSSGWTKAVIELSKRAKVVRELNGTPITQSPMDYFGQLRALGELNGWNPTNFKHRYAVLGGYMGKQVMPQCRNEEELGRLLDSCTFRALKKDWRKDLPPKLYQTVHLEMTAKQRGHYQTMMEEFYAMIDEDVITADMVVTQMGKLRQVSSGIMLDNGKEIVFEDQKTNPKILAMLELVNTPGKSIVTHYHKATGKMLIDALRKAKIGYAYIQGNMKPADIVHQKEMFNKDPETRVLVGQERATALGHTLIGQPGDRCNKTIFVESSFSLYARSQLEDRNHRGDQDEPCTCFDLVVSPMDEIVIKSLLAKKDLANSMDDIVAWVRREKEKRYAKRS